MYFHVLYKERRIKNVNTTKFKLLLIATEAPRAS